MVKLQYEIMVQVQSSNGPVVCECCDVSSSLETILIDLLPPGPNLRFLIYICDVMKAFISIEANYIYLDLVD